jgi:hypothetical protein
MQFISTLWVFKGNDMDAVFVKHGIDVKESRITEWAYVCMEGVHFREHNPKRSNHDSRYDEVEGEDNDSLIDSKLKIYIDT